MNHPNESRLQQLFRLYEEGKLTDQEKKLIDDWFTTFEHGDPVAPLADAGNEERIAQELRARIRSGMQPARVRNLWPTIWKAASVAAVVAVISAVFLLKRDQPQQLAQQAPFQTISTGVGESKQLQLPDGTAIWLNAVTTVRVPANDTAQNRIVYLDKGEAFFQVKHNAARPFLVKTGPMITRDIGTAFNIRAYEPGHDYRVAVTSGIVSVAHQEPSGKEKLISERLIQGEQLVYNTARDIARVNTKKAEMASAWRNGNAVYADSLTLQEIGRELARHYAVSVTVAHPERDASFYTLHLTNQSLSQALERLTLASGISYSLDHQHLTINPVDKRMR